MWPSAKAKATNDDGLDNMWPSAKANAPSQQSQSALEEKLKSVEEAYQKDKDFYEEALEARMN